MLDIKDSDVFVKGRLGPGMMISVDLETGEVCTYVISHCACEWCEIFRLATMKQARGHEVRPICQKVLENTEVKKRVASAHPYKEWLQEKQRSLPESSFASFSVMAPESLMRRHLYVEGHYLWPSRSVMFDIIHFIIVKVEG